MSLIEPSAPRPEENLDPPGQPPAGKNDCTEPVIAADSLGAVSSPASPYEMEIVVPDGHGGTCLLAVTGRAERYGRVQCASHFVAFGVCVDCTQAAGKRVWAT